MEKAPLQDVSLCLSTFLIWFSNKNTDWAYSLTTAKKSTTTTCTWTTLGILSGMDSIPFPISPKKSTSTSSPHTPQDDTTNSKLIPATCSTWPSSAPEPSSFLPTPHPILTGPKRPSHQLSIRGTVVQAMPSVPLELLKGFMHWGLENLILFLFSKSLTAHSIMAMKDAMEDSWTKPFGT